MPDRPVALNTFIAASGYHEAAWRVLDDDPRDVVSLAHFVEAARIAERAGFDSVFLADSPGVVEFRTQFLPQAAFDPIQVMTALAARTGAHRADRDRVHDVLRAGRGARAAVRDA